MDKSKQLYRDWLNLRTHLLWCYDHSIYQEEHASVYHSREFTNSSAWLVRSGWAQVQYGDKVWRAAPGQWLIVRPGQRLQSFRSDTHLLSVAFEAVWPDGSQWLEKGLPVVFDASEQPALERKAKQMAGILKKVSPVKWDVRQMPINYRQFLQLERMLSDWLLVLVDTLVARDVLPMGRYTIDDRVMKALYLLDSHPLATPLDLGNLAGKVGLSLRHLNQLFNHELGTTPKQYYDHRRLEEARHRLQMTHASIKYIAHALGFTYLSHFSKWFKMASGQSPRDFCRAATADKPYEISERSLKNV